MSISQGSDMGHMREDSCGLFLSVWRGPQMEMIGCAPTEGLGPILCLFANSRVAQPNASFSILL